MWTEHRRKDKEKLGNRDTPARREGRNERREGKEGGRQQTEARRRVLSQRETDEPKPTVVTPVTASLWKQGARQHLEGRRE